MFNGPSSPRLISCNLVDGDGVRRGLQDSVGTCDG